MKFRKRINIFIAVTLAFFVVSSVRSNTEEKISANLKMMIQKQGEQSRFTVWIFFKDKGHDLDKKMKAVQSSLNPRTLKRRLRHLKHTPLVDEYDVPVEDKYIQSVQSHTIRIRHRSRWLNAVSAEAYGYALHRIADLALVKKIDRVRSFHFREPDLIQTQSIEKPSLITEPHAFDYGPSFNQLNQINVPALHDLGYSGKGVLICMLDTGFKNFTHQALDHLDIQATWDFVNDDPNVFDEEGQMGVGNHGTQTLGTIGGYHPGELISPAYGASYILGKTENTEWERHIEEDHWVAGAEWADDLGADIISSSLGYRYEFDQGEEGYTSEDMDGETAITTRGANIAASRGILIVNSAGNEGPASPPDNTIIAPSDSPDVIAAGAVDPSGMRVEFSSMGPTADGRIKPDVMAQGLNVYTVEIGGSNIYDSVAGTSFSCPLTAGVAALILEINPTWTNYDIMDAIISTADNSSSPNNQYGWGIVDAYGAAFYGVKKIFPPQSFAVQRIPNNYIFFMQFVDRLTWSANPGNEIPVASYRLYEIRSDSQDNDFVLIAELDSQTFTYDRRGLLFEETYIYKITSVSESGEESAPVYATYSQ
ncbi:MAG: S8 family serine peptidase [Candidatus Aminicenantaceae bacterium]